MLRAVIFDFNGIIVDDEPIHFELFQRVLNEEGITLTEADYYARYLGCDDRGAFTTAYREHGRALSHSKLADLIERKAAYYQEDIKSKMRVFPGVETLSPPPGAETTSRHRFGRFKKRDRDHSVGHRTLGTFPRDRERGGRYSGKA